MVKKVNVLVKSFCLRLTQALKYVIINEMNKGGKRFMKKAIGVDFFSQVKMLSWLEKYKDTIYFVGTQADIEHNDYHKNIYQLKNGEVRQLTASNDVGSYTCHKKGLRFRKIDAKDPWNPKTGIYELPYDGGEAQIIFELPYALTDILWVDETSFFFTAKLDLKMQRLLAMGLSQKEASEKMTKDLKQCREFVEVPFWSNGGGDISETRTTLFFYHEGVVERLSEDQENISLKCLSLNKKVLYYTKRKITNGLSETFNSLHSYDLEQKTHQVHVLFDHEVSYGNVDMIDEKTALLSVGLREKYGNNENDQYFKWNLEKDSVVKIYNGDPYSGGNSVGSDVKMGNRWSHPIFTEDGFYMLSTVQDHAPILKIGYDGSVTAVTKEMEMIQEMIKDDQGFIVIAMAENHANEIYHLDLDGKRTALTQLNSHLEEEYQYLCPQTLSFINENGIEIKGWVILPPNYQENEKCPAILDIHGGPKTVYGPHLFHEMQWLAAKGYAVMFTNPTGSDGRGNLFSDIRGKYGTVDYRDLMRFVDVVLEKYPGIDDQRLGVTGGSYGGFMTNWIIGHTSRFKAAVSQRSIASWLIFENTSDIGYTFGVDQTGSDQWHDWNKLWQQSPIQFANKVTTPTLFIHSDEDTRCWMAEGISMFYALKRHGVDSKLCLFKGENHELSRSGKPQNRVRRLEELLHWMDRYLK